MKVLANELKGKTIITSDFEAKVLCSNNDNDVVIKHQGKFKCIKNGNFKIKE